MGFNELTVWGSTEESHASTTVVCLSPPEDGNETSWFQSWGPDLNCQTDVCFSSAPYTLSPNSQTDACPRNSCSETASCFAPAPWTLTTKRNSPFSKILDHLCSRRSYLQVCSHWGLSPGDGLRFVRQLLNFRSQCQKDRNIRGTY